MKYINDSTRIFAGFYESFLSAEYQLERYCEDLDSTDENEYDIIKYEDYQNDICKQCTRALFDNLQQDKDIIHSITFVKLHSPKYYNFETDKLELDIYCNWKELVKFIQKNKKSFDYYLQGVYSNYDGFISFVPNNYEEFMNKLEDDFERLSQVIIEYYLLTHLDTEEYQLDCIDIADDTAIDYIQAI